MAQNNWFVYILECENGTYYTGIAKDVEKRFREHLEGSGAKFMRISKPKQVIFTEKCVNMNDALKREAEIKKLRKSEKKELAKIERV